MPVSENRSALYFFSAAFPNGYQTVASHHVRWIEDRAGGNRNLRLVYSALSAIADSITVRFSSKFGRDPASCWTQLINLFQDQALVRQLCAALSGTADSDHDEETVRFITRQLGQLVHNVGRQTEQGIELGLVVGVADAVFALPRARDNGCRFDTCVIFIKRPRIGSEYFESIAPLPSARKTAPPSRTATPELAPTLRPRLPVTVGYATTTQELAPVSRLSAEWKPEESGALVRRTEPTHIISLQQPLGDSPRPWGSFWECSREGFRFFSRMVTLAYWLPVLFLAASALYQHKYAPVHVTSPPHDPRTDKLMEALGRPPLAVPIAAKMQVPPNAYLALKMLVRMSAQLETATEQLVILGTNGAVPVNIRLFEETWDDLYCTLSGKSCAAGSDEGYSELHQQALELVSTLEDLFEKQLTAIREELQSLNDVFLGLETWVKGFSVKAARRCWSVLGYDLWCGSDRRNVGDAYFAYGRLLTDLAQLINDSRERRGLAIKDMRTTTILQRGLLRVLSLDKSLSPATIYYLARSASEMTAEAMQNQKDAEAGASNRWFLLRLWSWVTSSSPRQRTQTESPDALQAVDPTDSLEAIASEAVIAGYLYDGIGIKLRWKAADFEKENSSLSALSQNVKSDVDWYWQTKNPASFSQIQDRFAGLVHWYNEFWGILILHNIEFTEQWNRELRED